MHSPIGDVIELRAGTSGAQITTVGAHLRRFEVSGHEVILPFGDELPWGAHGAVLAPWPGRIDAGRYLWDGETHQLPITEPERNTALHGLVMSVPWEASSTADCATLRHELFPQPGYPFHLDLSIEYRLQHGSLAVTFAAQNLGEVAAPFGIGFHPWLAAGPGGLEEATLQIRTDSWYPVDERLLPAPQQEVPHHLDFRSPREIGQTRFDDTFGQPERDASGKAWVHLRRGDGRTASVWMNPPLAVWQIFSDPGSAPRAGLAVEPMSCSPNAFNSRDLLYRLEPGKTYRGQWGLMFA